MQNSLKIAILHELKDFETTGPLTLTQGLTKLNTFDLSRVNVIIRFAYEVF